MEFPILLDEYAFYGDGGKSEGTADEDLGGKKTYTSPTWRGGGWYAPKTRMQWNPHLHNSYEAHAHHITLSQCNGGPRGLAPRHTFEK